MKRIILILAVAASVCSAAYAGSADIIPQPSSITTGDGEYVLPERIVIRYGRRDLKKAAEYLKEIIAPSTGREVTLTRLGRGCIRLRIRKSAYPDDESYTLISRSDRGVTVTASGYRGIVHGISTLRQLLPLQIESREAVSDIVWAVPEVEIRDTPKYGWRGLMLDTARHFFTVRETENLLDLMALYKFSKFHWHLSDNQGFRLEIPGYPALSQMGAWRVEGDENIDKACLQREAEEGNEDFRLNEECFRQTDSGRVYGGNFTEKDVQEIVEFASVRGIDIIPEIDMPAHSRRAIQCYPWMKCDPEGSRISPLCVGNDSVMQYARDVYREVFRLFPGKYVHIGGDEVCRDYWEKCPLCLKRVEDEHLDGITSLQGWFTREMEKYFTENGKTLIGWEEILGAGLSSDAVAQWWTSQGTEALDKAAARGGRIICSPSAYLYFDHAETPETLRGLFEAQIVPEGYEDIVLGLQGNIWTELIPSEARLQYMTFPRALVLAEKSWSGASGSWEEYLSRMDMHCLRLQTMHVKYSSVGL